MCVLPTLAQFSQEVAGRVVARVAQGGILRPAPETVIRIPCEGGHTGYHRV